MKSIYRIPFAYGNLQIEDRENGKYYISPLIGKGELYFTLKCLGCNDLFFKKTDHHTTKADYYNYCTYECERINTECKNCTKKVHKGECEIKCPFCKKEFPLHKFHKVVKGKGGYCKECNSIRMKEYRQRPSSIKAKRKRDRVWKKANPEKVKASDEIQKKYRREETKRLDDKYVRKSVGAYLSLKAKDVPQPLVDLYREQILLRRTIKEIKQKESK